MATTFIYALCEPNSRTVRYIGKADDPLYRFKQHLRESVRAKTHLGNWLRLLVSRKQEPILVVLREIPDEQREIAEERYIRLARGLGMALVNGTDGGDGCHNPSPETRVKMGSGLRGKTGSAHPKFGVQVSVSARAQIGVSQTGDKNHRFGKVGEESATFGRKHTEEECAKMSASKIGKPVPSATLAAAVAATKGVPQSVEHRAKNSAAQKLVWARRKAAKS